MRMGRTSELVCAGLISLAGISYVMTVPGRAASDWATSSEMISAQFMQEDNVRPLSPDAARVALSALALDEDPFSRNSLAALTSRPAAEIDLGEAGRLQVAIIDDDTRDAAHAGLSAFADHSPVVLDRGQREAVVAVNYERAFEQPGNAETLDVALTPRAGVSVGPDGSAAGAGAELRLGRFMHTETADNPSWYIFAGADRRALMYDPGKGMDFEDGAMYLTQREVIGDAQAGIAVRVWDADLSLAYVRREYEHIAGVTKFDETEEFGAVTVNWRW